MDPTALALVDNRLPLNPKLTSILDLQLESVSFLADAAAHNYHSTVATERATTFLKNPQSIICAWDHTNISKLGVNLQEEHEAQEEARRRWEGGDLGMSRKHGLSYGHGLG